MDRIIAKLSDGTEIELASYIRSDSELRPIVVSYLEAVNVLKQMTAANLSEYTIKYGDDVATTQTGMEVEYVRFPSAYESQDETDVVSMYVKLRKTIQSEVKND